MAIYIYKALNQQGRVIRGKISARNENELEAKLSQSGLDLIDADELKAAGISLFSTISTRELVLICVHMHQLENAGVSILDSISDLRDSTESQAIKNVMMDVYDSLKNGKLLSAAFADHPRVFDKIFISLVAAGEKTGNFSEVFKHLENHLKWMLDIKNKIKKATYYPLFLLLLMTGVIMVMMMYVIPKLTVFLVAQNIELPFYTKALISSSDFIVNNWQYLLAVPAFIYIVLKFLKMGSERMAYYLDFIMLKIPFLGSVVRKLENARFCHFFSITYKSGMGILECLDVSGSVVQNKVIKEGILSVKSSVIEGKKLTDALKATDQFPSLVIRMFKIGEDSGNLDQALQNVNHFFDQEVNDSINGFVGVLQPMLTMVMGGLLMWITISVFGPVYSSFGV